MKHVKWTSTIYWISVLSLCFLFPGIAVGDPTPSSLTAGADPPTITVEFVDVDGTLDIATSLPTVAAIGQLVEQEVIDLVPYDLSIVLVQAAVLGAEVDSMLVHLAKADAYEFESVNVELGPGMTILSMQWGCSPSKWVMPSSHRTPVCPDDRVEIVFATPVELSEQDLDDIDFLVDLAVDAGYHVKTLLEGQATVQAYQDYLMCPNLRGFGSVGHGSNEGILLQGGILDYTWFESVSLPNDAVIHLNSCEVHNFPLEPAIMGAGARTFIGGDEKLPVGDSEDVFLCQWESVLERLAPMGDSLNACEEAFDLVGYHGISGDTGYFSWFVHNPISHQSSYNAEPEYSGIAVGSMLIDSLDATSDPEQLEIESMFYGPQGVPGSGATPDDLQDILEHYTLADGYYWSTFSTPDVNSLLFAISYWQEVNGYAAAIPAKGDYLHWLAVEGVVADTPPSAVISGESFALRGLFVEDPALPDGFSKSFKTAACLTEPSNGYFSPTNGSDYEAVIEPPPASRNVVYVDPPSFGSGCTPSYTNPSTMCVGGFDPVEAALHGIESFELDFVPSFFDAWFDTQGTYPILVDRVDGGEDYILVPFVRSSDGKITVVVRLRSDNGRLLEVAYNAESGLTAPYNASTQLYWSPSLSKSPFLPVDGGKL